MGGKAGNPYLSMALLLVLWGSFSAVSKLTLQDLDGYQMMFLMFAFAFAIMTVIHMVTGELCKLSRISPGQFALTALISLPSFLYYLLYFLALERIPVIEAAVLNYLFPVFILVFSIPLNREKMQLYKLGSMILGFAGMMVIITNGKLQAIRLTNITGDLLAVGAAASWALFSVLGKTNGMDMKISNYLTTAISFMLSSACVLFFSRIKLPGLPALGGALWLSGSNIVLGYYLWFRILKTTSSAIASSMSFITPFVAFLFIALLLHEKITAAHIAGLVLVMAGFVLQYLPAVIKPGDKNFTARG